MRKHILWIFVLALLSSCVGVRSVATSRTAKPATPAPPAATRQ